MEYAFQQTQQQFTTCLRDGVSSNALGLEPERLQIYVDLVYSNIEQFIANTFPVLRSLCNDIYWHNLIRTFVKNHYSQTPYFLKICEEFLQFILVERNPESEDFPFLKELAHYEWLELYVDTLDVDTEKSTAISSITAASQFKISPAAVVARYNFAVQKISPLNIPLDPLQEPVNLIVYRDCRDAVNFMEINFWSLLLIQVLMNSEKEGLTKVYQQLIAKAAQLGVPTLAIPSFEDLVVEINILCEKQIIFPV